MFRMIASYAIGGAIVLALLVAVAREQANYHPEQDFKAACAQRGFTADQCDFLWKSQQSKRDRQTIDDTTTVAAMAGAISASQ